MSDSLSGARIGLLEARRESELASLVRRHGGLPMSAPALLEIERECAAEVSLAIDAIHGGGGLVVFATGVGLDRWLRIAADLGRLPELRQGLAMSTVACRGPKPIAVLKREGLEVHLRAPPPHTTKELLGVLETVEVRDRHAVYVHDGGGLSTVPDALAVRGARVTVLQPYTWGPPANPGPLNDLIRSVVQGDIDAIAVTTQAQATYLFSAAAALGLQAELRDALRRKVVVAAVGPTCARALMDLGVPPHVVPSQAKMGPLVLALAAHLAGHGSR